MERMWSKGGKRKGVACADNKETQQQTFFVFTKEILKETSGCRIF